MKVEHCGVSQVTSACEADSAGLSHHRRDLPQHMPALSDAALADAIVAKIRSVTRARTLEHALEIGEILVHGAYEGDLDAARKVGDAHPMYRRIASHPELPFGTKQLWVCLKIHGIVQDLPQFRASRHLGVAHLRAVVNLPCEVQERLLMSAERESWTSGRLEDEARSHRRLPSNRGRPPTIALCRAVERIERVATEVESELSRRLRGDLSQERAAHAHESLRRARASLDAIEAELRRWAGFRAAATG